MRHVFTYGMGGVVFVVSAEAAGTRDDHASEQKDYQPHKADMEREYDMPGTSSETIRSAFFRSFTIRREVPD